MGVPSPEIQVGSVPAIPAPVIKPVKKLDEQINVSSNINVVTLPYW